MRVSPRRMRSRLARISLGALVLSAAFLAQSAGKALAARGNIVSPAPRPPSRPPPNTAYFTTIQAAVNAATAGDRVLIEPGTYDEEVKVSAAHAGIWIRGMNRTP